MRPCSLYFIVYIPFRTFHIYNTSWHSSHTCIIGNVVRYDRICSYCHIVSYHYFAYYFRTWSYVYFISYNRYSFVLASVGLSYCNALRNVHVIAYNCFGIYNNCTIMSYIKTFTYTCCRRYLYAIMPLHEQKFDF